MQFILTGFTQDKEFRVFAFEGIAADRVRTPFTVRADLSLSRTYGIRLQELPLMCRAILEHREEGSEESVKAEDVADVRAEEGKRHCDKQKSPCGNAPRKQPFRKGANDAKHDSDEGEEKKQVVPDRGE